VLTLINPGAQPFDDPDWQFEAKFDGFRAAADTVRGRLTSPNSNRMQRSRGECLISYRRAMCSMASLSCSMTLDALYSRSCYLGTAARLTWPDGADLRTLLLKQRKSALARIGEGAEGWSKIGGLAAIAESGRAGSGKIQDVCIA
jgi:hypothetical protein